MFHWKYSRINMLTLYSNIDWFLYYLSISLISKRIEYFLYSHNFARFPINSFPHDPVGLSWRNTQNFADVVGHDIYFVNLKLLGVWQYANDRTATYPLSQALFNFIFLCDVPFNVCTHFPQGSLSIVNKKSDFFAKFYRHHSIGRHCLKTPVERSGRSCFSLVEG